MQFMSNSSDETNPQEARTVRSWRRRVIPIVVLLLAAAGIGGVVLWEKYGGFAAPSQTAATETETESPATTPVAVETSQGSDTTAQLLKDLQTSQQQAADKLEDIQRQLAAEQGERKLLAEQVEALTGRVNSLSASNASVGTALQAAKKKPKLPDTVALRPAGGNR
jgi:uncharacterized protein HemX